MIRAVRWLLASCGFAAVGAGMEAAIGEHPVLFAPLALTLATGAVGVCHWVDAAKAGESR